MIAHYLANALRYFKRAKFTTAVNLLCLLMGLSCFGLAYGVQKVTRVVMRERIVESVTVTES